MWNKESEGNQTSWPRRFPVYRILGLILALACTAGLSWLWLRSLPALERFYLPQYAKVTLFGDLMTLHLQKRPGQDLKPFHVVFLGPHSATTALMAHPEAGKLSVRTIRLEPKWFRGWLEHSIYGNRDLLELLTVPLVWFGIFLIGFVATGAYLDRTHNRTARDGRRLRGPQIMSRWKFNLRHGGDGIGFRLANRRNPIELLSRDSGRWIRIRKDKEDHHFQIAGDSGAGKTTLIRQILQQVEKRREVAIIFDPAREYITEFFNEERGDWILNPKDERCPYWPIGAEVEDEATATPIAMGLFPDAPTGHKFFVEHTRGIFANLLTYKPTVVELAYWMAHPEEIDKRVAGTEHAHTLTANAAPQRAGILGTMNAAGKSLRMMPTNAEERRIWTVKEWVQERKGWIFITSTPDTIDAVRPLQSLWLDMLTMQLQSMPYHISRKKVWTVIDEVAALHMMPQMHNALTRQRKSGNPIVLGFQGMAQIEHLYGEKQAQTILSQAYTNIILRTREPRAAEHMAGLIGKTQFERISESKQEGGNLQGYLQNRTGRRNYSTERVLDNVVIESQIQGLPDLSGYFVQGSAVVPIRFKFEPRQTRAVGLIERTIPNLRTMSKSKDALPEPTVGASPGGIQIDIFG